MRIYTPTMHYVYIYIYIRKFIYEYIRTYVNTYITILPSQKLYPLPSFEHIYTKHNIHTYITVHTQITTHTSRTPGDCILTIHVHSHIMSIYAPTTERERERERETSLLHFEKQVFHLWWLVFAYLSSGLTRTLHTCKPFENQQACTNHNTYIHTHTKRYIQAARLETTFSKSTSTPTPWT
jgi:hypothetical protein